MNINEQEVLKLRTLLETYKKQHGTIATGSPESINCTCGASCTNSCETYCDGASSICWQTGHR